MRLSKAELRRAIEKEEKEYKPEELFSDGSMKPILESIIIGACNKLKKIPTLHIQCNPTSEFTAATDGEKVYQNTLGPLIRELPTNWEKYVANVGHTVHETGHVLFTPFSEVCLMMSAWDKGSLYPEKPKGADDVISAFEEKPTAQKLYVSLMRNIENTIEDAYIENLLRVVFDGVAVQGISLVNKEIFRKMGTKKEIIANAMDNNLPPIVIAEALLMSRFVCKDELPDGDLTPDEEKFLSLIDAVIATAGSEIKELMWEQDGKKRAMLYNEIFVKFFPLFPIEKITEDASGNEGDESGEEGDSQDSGNGKGSSQKGKSDNSGKESSEEKEENGSESSEDGSEGGSGKNGDGDSKDSSKEGENPSEGSSDGSKDISEAELRRIIDEARRIAREIGKSEDPENLGYGSFHTEIKVSSEDKEKAEEKAERADNAGEVNGTLALTKAIKEAVTQKALSEDEENHGKDLYLEAKNIEENATLYIENKGFDRFALTRPEPGKISEYNEIYRDVQKTSKNLVRKINNIMREREVESTDSGFMMGQRFNAKDIVNRDGKYFSRQIIPDGKLTVAFGILVDESGSMSGEKIIRARRTAILVEDALRNLGVPLMVTGHTAYHTGSSSKPATVLDCFKDFDTRDGKDHLRLTKICAQAGNIDGAAITYVGEKLLKRPESKKVLIVISDGYPAGHSFYSKSSNEDTSLAAKHYRKKGVEVFGAILDEVETVSSIYGKEYCFDCRTDGELERQLIRLIKKYVLMKG